MTKKTQIESALDHLAHLNRCIDLLSHELNGILAAAVTPEVQRLRAAADALEMEALDSARASRINADIDRLQDQAREMGIEIRAAVMSLGASVAGMDLEATLHRGRPGNPAAVVILKKGEGDV